VQKGFLDKKEWQIMMRNLGIKKGEEASSEVPS
jgi:hypothetical protein